MDDCSTDGFKIYIVTGGYRVSQDPAFRKSPIFM